MTDAPQRKTGRVTRRQFVGGAGAAGLGGLIVGGAGGYFGGHASAGADDGKQATSREPVTIGYLVPVTGPGAADGQEMLRGVRLALAQLNASGGVAGHEIKLSVLDAKDQSPNVMSNAMRKFVSERVAAIFSPFLTTTSAELPIPGEAGVVLLHNNTLQANVDFAIEHGYKNIFQCCPSETWYGPGFVDVLDQLEKQKQFSPRHHTAAIVTATDGFSLSIANGLRKVLQKRNWKIVQFDKYTSPQTDWGGTLARLRQNEPDIFFQSDYYAGNEASLIKQFRAAPTRSLVYQLYAPSVPQYRELSGSASDGVLWATVSGSIFTDDVGKRFVKEYVKEYNHQPGASNAGGQYDRVMLWALAAGLAQDVNDWDEVGDNVRRLIYRGINGAHKMGPTAQTCFPYPTKFNDSSLGMPTLTYQIQNGKQVVISPDPYTTGNFKTPAWLT